MISDIIIFTDNLNQKIKYLAKGFILNNISVLYTLQLDHLTNQEIFEETL